MIYKQQSYLPIIFQVDEGIILDVNEYLKRNKFSFTNVLVVSGKSFSRKFADELAGRNDWDTYVLEDNSFSDVDALKEYVRTHNTDLIVGVGGGKVIDTVKRVSYLTNINPLAVPTIISNDGLISPIAVIKNEQDRTESLPGMMPMGVIIDIDIIRDSPLDFIRAAAGDILSNISATNDWILAFQNGKERMNDIAFHLAKSAATALVHYKDIDLRDKRFLRLVVQGQINSGIAMSLAGTSRPCSGSEHLISHAIDYLGWSRALHGTQVASISLFTLFLQGKLRSEYLTYAKTTGIPLNFSTIIEDFKEEKFLRILDLARQMRSGRYTIISTKENNQIYSAFEEFESKLSLN